MVDLKIENEQAFDSLLRKLAQGVPMNEKVEINKAGMSVFKAVLKPKVNAIRSTDFPETKDGKTIRYKMVRNEKGKKERQKVEEFHMADTLTTKIDKKTGKVSIGFSKKGKKAYIARFMNDGWKLKNQYGGPYKDIPGKHFWESSEAETHDTIPKAMLPLVNKYFNELKNNTK